MSSAVDSTLEERGSRYGEFPDHARITQSLKRVMHSEPGWYSTLSDSHREALEMIMQKIGRILNGDPNYKDSWVNIEGYARLISRELSD